MPTVWMRYVGPDPAAETDDVLAETPYRIRVGDGRPFRTSSLQVTWLEDIRGPNGKRWFERCAVSEDFLRDSVDAPRQAHGMPSPSRPAIQAGAASAGRPRVLFLAANEPGYSGGRVWDWQIARGLAAAGCAVRFVATCAPAQVRDWPATEGMAVEVVRDLAGVNAKDFDLVVGAPPQGLLPAVRLADEMGVPYALTMYESDNWLTANCPDMAGWADPSRVGWYAGACAVIVPSELAARHAREWDAALAGQRLLVVRPQANLRAAYAALSRGANPEPKLDGPGPWLVHCGRTTGHKGWMELLWATALHDRDYNVAFVGQNTWEIAASQFVHRGWNARRCILTFDSLTDEQKFGMFAQAATGVVLSRHEGFGLVPAEFLIMGRPFVALENEQLRAEYGDALVYSEGLDVAAVRRALDCALDGRNEISREVVIEYRSRHADGSFRQAMRPVVECLLSAAAAGQKKVA